MRRLLLPALSSFLVCSTPPGLPRELLAEAVVALDGLPGRVVFSVAPGAEAAFRRAGLIEVSEKSRTIARRLDRTGYYSRMSRAYKGYPHLRANKTPSGASRVSTAVNAGNRIRYRSQLRQIARANRLDPGLLDAVIVVESGYDPDAVSPKGAMGLMQLMPHTADRFRIDDPFNAVENMRGGARYLRWLMDRFDGELALVLAAYNAGEGAVERHGNRVPPYPETQRYVGRILELYRDADSETEQ